MAAILEWKKLVSKPDSVHGMPCKRSSHGFSILKNGTLAVLYGGETIARTPLDASQAAWAADRHPEDGAWTWRLIDTSSPGAPPQRVAHAQAVYNDSIVYVFGGRAGITMQEKAMDDLWKLDCSGPPGTESWSRVEPNSNGDAPPEARSFHKMLCIGESIYVFGGCSAHHGRLADIHRFDITTSTWHNMGASKLLPGRGGANFLTLSSGDLLAVIAGFCGVESNDGHIFNRSSGKWDAKDITGILEGLRPRSVCVSGSFPSLNLAIIFGGEVDPSAKGHEGAGGFANDVVLLDESSGRYLGSISADQSWPEPRGWAASASLDFPEKAESEFFLFGGLTGDDTNPRRLDDFWQLTIRRGS